MEKTTIMQDLSSHNSAYVDVPTLEEALWAHNLGTLTGAKKLDSGLVNQTWLCQTATAQYIVQKKAKPFDIQLYQHLFVHLHAHDVAIPRLFMPQASRQSSDSMFVFSYTQNNAPDVCDPLTYLTAGSLLAKTHVALRSFTYPFESAIPHFHDARFYAQKLREVFPAENREATISGDVTYLQKRLRDSSDFMGVLQQPIHGDPKLANILFTDNTAQMLIDWEACMRGSIYFDIGDALRSWCKTSQNSPATYDTFIEQLFLRGYASVAHSTPLERPLVHKAVSGLIAELSTRYLIDSVEGTYFSYPCGVDTKAENLIRAKKGIAYHKAFCAITKYGDGTCVA